MNLTKKEKAGLRDFKLRVELEAYNAVQLSENIRRETGRFISTKDHIVKIGNATFTFYPHITRDDIDEQLKKFTTTKLTRKLRGHDEKSF